MPKKDLENIMIADDEVAIQLAKATLLLSDLNKKEEDADKRALYTQASDFVLRASECINQVLLLKYPDLEDDHELEDGLKEPMTGIVAGLKDENPDVQNAYAEMIKRGESSAYANQEIGRAFVGCVYEADRGMPDRFQEVLAAIAAGKSTADLFPDALYAAGNETTN